MEKSNDKKDNVPEEKANLSLGLGVFNKDNYLVFFYKKTEKIITALYLITNLFPAAEPLKWSIRQSALRILGEELALTGKRNGQGEPFQIIATSFLEVISFLEVGYFSGLISEMNFSLIKKEIEKLLESIEAKEKPEAQKNSTIGKDFFMLSEEYFSGIRSEGNLLQKSIDTIRQSSYESVSGIHSLQDLRKSVGAERDKRQTEAPIKDIDEKAERPEPTLRGARALPRVDRESSDKGQDAVPERKSDRREQILSLLKNQGNLSIKDFSTVIKGCSEKTIQRELLAMVAEGVLKKEGERRWSTYSIV